MKKEISNLQKLKIIKNGKVSELNEMLRSIERKEIQSIQKENQLFILKELRNSKNSKARKEKIWEIIFFSDSMENIRDFANSELKEFEETDQQSFISHELRHAISYLLFKSSKKEIEKILLDLSKSRSNEIKLIAAEYYIYKKQNNKAIEIFIGILEDQKVDHNVSDAIDLHMENIASNEILLFIEQEIKNEKYKKIPKKIDNLEYFRTIIKKILKNNDQQII